MWVEVVLLGGASALAVGLHQEAPPPPLVGPDPKATIPLPQTVLNFHTPPAEEEAKASVHMQHLEQHIRSLTTLSSRGGEQVMRGSDQI